jgi:hypothetical protein
MEFQFSETIIFSTDMSLASSAAAYHLQTKIFIGH